MVAGRVGGSKWPTRIGDDSRPTDQPKIAARTTLVNRTHCAIWCCRGMIAGLLTWPMLVLTPIHSGVFGGDISLAATARLQIRGGLSHRNSPMTLRRTDVVSGFGEGRGNFGFSPRALDGNDTTDNTRRGEAGRALGRPKTLCVGSAFYHGSSYSIY